MFLTKTYEVCDAKKYYQGVISQALSPNIDCNSVRCKIRKTQNGSNSYVRMAIGTSSTNNITIGHDASANNKILLGEMRNGSFAQTQTSADLSLNTWHTLELTKNEAIVSLKVDDTTISLSNVQVSMDKVISISTNTYGQFSDVIIL